MVLHFLHVKSLQPYHFTGQKSRLYNCCSRPVENSEGCIHGPHVFYESQLEDLHARYPFSCLEPASPTNTTALDVAAIDCEMIYTTGGIRVARVSVVDGSGKEIFDQLVRMDPGVEVMYVLFPSTTYTKA